MASRQLALTATTAIQRRLGNDAQPSPGACGRPSAGEVARSAYLALEWVRANPSRTVMPTRPSALQRAARLRHVGVDPLVEILPAVRDLAHELEVAGTASDPPPVLEGVRRDAEQLSDLLLAERAFEFPGYASHTHLRRNGRSPVWGQRRGN